jgi:hypothetical protein
MALCCVVGLVMFLQSDAEYSSRCRAKVRAQTTTAASNYPRYIRPTRITTNNPATRNMTDQLEPTLRRCKRICGLSDSGRKYPFELSRVLTFLHESLLQHTRGKHGVTFAISLESPRRLQSIGDGTADWRSIQ